jgi:hypothetical protein
MKYLKRIQAVGDVPRIAVKEEKCPLFFRCRDKPAMEGYYQWDLKLISSTEYWGKR